MFDNHINVYRYGFQYLRLADQQRMSVEELRQQMFQSLLEIGYAFLDAGMVFITTVRGLTSQEAKQLRSVSQPFEVLIINLETDTEFTDIVFNDVDESNQRLVDTVISNIK